MQTLLFGAEKQVNFSARRIVIGIVQYILRIQEEHT